MKLKLPLVAAFAAIISLTACGGGSDSGNAAVVLPNPAALTKTDTVLGTGAEAAAGTTVAVHYTLYLYSDSVANFKGTQLETSVGASPYTFKLGTGAVIPGFEQGVLGMKAGGKRTILVPSSLGYGASGSGKVPPNAGLVFDLDLVTVN